MSKAGVKVLFVDSDLPTQGAAGESFKNRFLKLGYVVRVAEDGFAALQQLITALPDVLISSLEIPGISGIELQSHVTRQFPLVYTIVLKSEILRGGLQSGNLLGGFPDDAPCVPALLQAVSQGLAEDRRSPLSYRKSAPIIIRRGESSRFAATELFARCSECHRSFPQLTDANRLQRETACVHCRVPMNPASARQLVAAS